MGTFALGRRAGSSFAAAAWLAVAASFVVVSIALPHASRAAETDATREMARLAKQRVGDWETREIVQYGKPVPEGAGRRGIVHVRLAAGGSVLVADGHSNGSVGGDLRWHIVTWWDATAKVYRIFTCFKTSRESGCEVRGTAHWDGATFVNEYQEVVDGRKVRARDLWTNVTPNSFKLTEAIDIGNGTWEPYVVSEDTRLR